MQRSVLFLTCVCLFCFSCTNDASKKAQPLTTDPVFDLLDPDATGIQFNNALTEGLNTNILMYEYFYNGGGVAVGDINGDGLEDIYFSANMTDNKLYLNRGNMKFEDVTGAAGAGGRPGPWKTGVTMADVNGDGLPDIYLCYSGKLTGEKRKNQLFINQGPDENGIPVFTDQAELFGIADSSYSTQGYFFDYDRDGDLDLFLLNHNPNSLPVLDIATTQKLLAGRDLNVGVKLFRNDNGKFRDVTETAQLSSSSLTYGLGAGIADIDGDGWPDIYICNDYTAPEYLYINNGNGTFTDKKNAAFGHTPNFGMGNDVSDINNDGYPDIIALDMLPEDNYRQKMLMAPDNYEKFDLMLHSGFHYQYMRNMLQLNNGNGTFSETGQISGISNTDWSWAPLCADYDNDGWKDMFVTNGFTRDYTNMDFLKYMNDFLQHNSANVRRENVLNLVQQMPASDVLNYMFRNKGGFLFEDVSRQWGFSQPSNSNGAVYADLDNDGDLDLVVNNINRAAFVYENTTAGKNGNHYLQVSLEGAKGNTQGIGAKIYLYAGGAIQSQEQMPARGYQSSVSPVMHFGLGDQTTIDSLRVVWSGGKTALLTGISSGQRMVLKESEAKDIYRKPAVSPALFTEKKAPLVFAHARNDINDFKRQPLMVSPMSFFGPCIVKADVNGDGREDIFTGGATGQPAQLWLQKADGGFQLSAQPALEADKIHEDTDAVFFDADGDGDLDLYVASGGYHSFTPNDNRLQDRLYMNDGKGAFSKTTGMLPEMYVSKSCVRAADINGDGHTDLFVGGRVIPGRYPETPESFVLINDGKGKFENKTQSLAPALQKAGMVTDAVWHDMNGDNQPDLMLVGEWMPVSVFINENGKLVDKTGDFFEKSYKGWWNKILLADLNGDGRKDLVLGNMGLNTQCRVSDKEPAEMFFSDFDDNGSVDPMLTFYIQGKSYPYVTRDELLDQMSTMRTRYTNYKDYANLTITDIFTGSELTGAGHLSANHLETSYFEMGSDNRFHIRSLPEEVQISPVFTITALDYNRDGHTDLLLCGNINQARLRFGKYDANYGILLRGDGKGNFDYIPQWMSGFNITGDVRAVVPVENGLLFGINQSPLIMYSLP